MSNEYRKHLSSQLKHVSMNNWNYTEYNPVVPHYLIDNYVRYDIWSRLPAPCDFD